MASAPILQNYVPDAFFKITDPLALQKYIVKQLQKISNAVSLVNAVAQPAPVAFSKAPAGPPKGMLQPFTDSTTVTWGATITGGGANFVLGHWNGTNWTVAAK